MNYLTFFLQRPADLREYLGSFLSYNLLPIILNMSLTGALVILFVLLIRRYLLKKAPKIFSYALRAVVLFRLLCPVSFSTGFSLMSFFDPPALRSESGGASVVEYIPSDIVQTESGVANQQVAVLQAEQQHFRRAKGSGVTDRFLIHIWNSSSFLIF